MNAIRYLHTALTVRLAELRGAGDRGDSPVPTAVIIMGLAFVATVVTAAALGAANDWMDNIPGAANPVDD